MEDERERLKAHYRIQILENELAHLKDDVEDHEATLYNDGKGIVFDVRQLKHERNNRKEGWATVISILAVILSLLSVVLQILKDG